MPRQVNYTQPLEMEPMIQEEIESLNIDLITIEIQLEISKLLMKSRRSSSFGVGQLSPKAGLKSQLGLCTVDLGLLANALESRHAHQFTLNALFIRQGEPISDLSLEEIATFIYQHKSLVTALPLHRVRAEVV